MHPLSLSQLRSIVGGKPLTPAPDGHVFIRAVCTDSRKLEPGCLFVAIRGENHDAHQFVPDLRPVSAGGTVVAALVEREPLTYPPGVYVLHVPSTRLAMGKLASFIRHQFTGNVIAVGGSNGKTSTKHLIDAALSCKLQGSISPKSFNNDIGVPLTIFNHDPLFHYLVLEMGTNHHGEMKLLSDMAQPDIAVITSISHEHLEGLGDLSGVRREEAAILSGVSPKGLLVVNGDDPELLPHLAPFPGKRVTFGFSPTNDLFATQVRLSDAGTTFNLNGSRREVFVPLLGRHTATNALAAIAVARRMGLDEEAVLAALAGARGPEMRQQLQVLSGITVLNDAYNANPASVRNALETFLSLSIAPGSRRIAVLGEMRELGDESDALHRQIGAHVAALPLDRIVFVGRQGKLMLEAAHTAGFAPSQLAWFSDSASAAAALKPDLRDGDRLLLKGSRGVRLEAIADALKSPDSPAPLKVAV